MPAMVGVAFHHSRLLGTSDCQPCFYSAERPYSSACMSEDAPGPVVIVCSTSKSRLGMRRQEPQCRTIRGSKAGFHKISPGIRKIGHNFVAAAKDVGTRKPEFKARAMENEEFERGIEGGERVLTQSRVKGNEETNLYNAVPDGEQSDPADVIAAAAKAATLAVEKSTEEFVEKAEDVLGVGRKSSARSKFGNPETWEEGLLGLEDERFLRRVAAAENADAALAMVSERGPGSGGVVSNGGCSNLILAAIAQNNVDLAFSILKAMRSSLLQRRIDRQEDLNGERGKYLGWRWPQPDVTTYVALVRGLAASLHVSDAIQTVADVRRRGVPQGDEVPFGEVVNCPTCKTSLAVVQPQHGVQLVPCASCRYQYELMSGVIVTSESESISSDTPFWEKGLKMLPFLKRRVPSAVHSIVVRAPDGLARALRFATESADVPAQEGERVTMVLASPANVGPRLGPIRFKARVPGWQPREPMSVTNHVTGQILNLIRAPRKAGSRAAFDSSTIVPIALLLASTDAASGLIDPTLPSLVAVGATAALTLGGAANTFLLPRLNQLPQRTVDAIALRQRLLAQYGQLQARLQELTQAASDEVRMLARMCQLQNKMEAVGEASYSARIERVRKARNGLDERLAARLELMDSYAKVASMIEIEVEMDIDVLAAEAASPEASIVEQIERLMEVESLQNEWKNQAEVNDEVERLLRAAPLLPESA